MNVTLPPNPPAIVSAPIGATPVFNDPTSPTPTVTFDMAGDYVFRCTATDSNGATGHGDVAVSVPQELTAFQIVHQAAIVSSSAVSVDFDAVAADQFGHAMDVAIVWTVAGNGFVDDEGLWTTNTPGTSTITGTSGAFSASMLVTVSPSPSAVFPPADRVAAGESYGPTGTEFTGTLTGATVSIVSVEQNVIHGGR